MWERHGWEVRTTSCRHCVFVLLPTWLSNARFQEAPDLDWLAPFLLPPHQRPRPNQITQARILATMRRFENHLSPQNPFNAAFRELLVLELLLLLQQHIPRKPVRRSADLETYLDIVNRAVEITLYSPQPLTTNYIAQYCGVSPRTFSRVFQELVGISFPKFALRSRLGQTAAQLANTEIPIPTIAANWGFSNLNFFQRAFRQHYQVSPLDYRRKRR